jgi:hypothetical protein
MKNQANKKELKASVSELSGKNKLNLSPAAGTEFDLSLSVAALSWPVAVYKFVKNRSNEMFR